MIFFVLSGWKWISCKTTNCLILFELFGKTSKNCVKKVHCLNPETADSADSSTLNENKSSSN